MRVFEIEWRDGERAEFEAKSIIDALRWGEEQFTETDVVMVEEQ